MTAESARRYGLPLPAGSDPIRDGDQVIRQLSSATADALDNLASAVNSGPAAAAAAAAQQAADDAAAAARIASTVVASAAAVPDATIAAVVESGASLTTGALERQYVRVASRPVAVAAYLPASHATTDDATPYLKQALADSGGEVEWRDGLALTLGQGRITIPEGVTLRMLGGASAIWNYAASGFTVRGHLNGGTVSVRGVGLEDVAVLIPGGTTGATVTGTTTTGGGTGFALGDSHEATTSPLAAVDPVLTACHASGHAQWCYRLDQTYAATLVSCTGIGGLDVVKFRQRTLYPRIIGGRYAGATGGDGLDGFAGGEGAYVGGGVIFENNSQNGATFKADDDATGKVSIPDYRAANGSPSRLTLDGVISINNGGTGITAHRSDETDSDVTAGKPLPQYRTVTLQGVLSIGNARGFFVNARHVIGTGLHAISNTGAGFHIHAAARDVTLVSPIAAGNGRPTGSDDAYVLDGQRIRLITPIAHGVHGDFVSDADAAAIPKSERPTRFGYKIGASADVWMLAPAARWCRVAALSDATGRTVIHDHDLRDPTTDQLIMPTGTTLAPGAVLGHRTSAGIARAIWQASTTALAVGDNGSNGYDELMLAVKPYGAITATGHLRPQTTAGGYALGDSARRWAHAWLGSHAIRVNAGKLEISTDGTNWTAPTT